MKSIALLSVAVALLFTTNAFAQQKSQQEADPFDLTAIKKSIQEGGLPTASSVDTLETTAFSLFEAKDCVRALPALEHFARQANSLANLISSGLDPFYRASYDDRRATHVDPLVPYERKANAYKAKRNLAMVMQAECHLAQGRREVGIGVLLRALQLISSADRAVWDRARTRLWREVGIADAK